MPATIKAGDSDEVSVWWGYAGVYMAVTEPEHAEVCITLDLDQAQTLHEALGNAITKYKKTIGVKDAD